MRVLVAITLFAQVACGGGSSHKECFECGLSDEWAHAAQERAARERAAHDEQMQAIDQAVTVGENGTEKQARLISETIYQGDRDALTQLVKSLETACRRQHPLAFSWTFHELSTGTLRDATDHEVGGLRERAFYLIAVSRGADARTAMGGCEGSPIEAVCARALAAIDQGRGPCDRTADPKPTAQ